MLPDSSPLVRGLKKATFLWVNLATLSPLVRGWTRRRHFFGVNLSTLFLQIKFHWISRENLLLLRKWKFYLVQQNMQEEIFFSFSCNCNKKRKFLVHPCEIAYIFYFYIIFRWSGCSCATMGCGLEATLRNVHNAHAHIRLATMGYGLEHYCACAYQRDSAVVSTTVQCALAVLKYAVYYKHHCAWTHHLWEGICSP